MTAIRAATPAPPEARPAFALVYEGQYAALVRLATITIGQRAAAEDVVQDVFAELYRRFDEIEAPVAYLRRAVVSRCISWRRRRGVERRHEHLVVAVDDVPALGPEATAVRAALRRLRPRQRAAVFLRYYIGLSEVEIAASLACRPGTVKSLLSRALGILREQLDDDRP